MIKAELMAPCGLYCGVCGVYVASTTGDEALKQKMAKAYGVTVEQVDCDGCMSAKRFVFCQVCGIRSCVEGKGLTGCHQCDQFPCAQIKDFPVPEGRAVILREVPRWREMGDEAWVAQLEARHSCQVCGRLHIRGARRCASCGQTLS